ncbi:MAG: diguanylate cyclase [Defluviitaleaceae bacterium]|nr:diguanylate cyclase [Defluviitaleaceae bacterium]MCL2835227.1 diguanylate cyclase [Defluviitaleaceae bacterium]
MAENKKEFTILITDDEKMNVDILGSVLSPMYNILISRNGQRAVELAKEYAPDLILLDVLMPEMSGFEVIAKLKESEATSKIPVIFITGLSNAEDEEKGFFLGAVDYITKPFHKTIVKARVNTHIKIIDQMRTIERIGLIDPLTKIANRRGFENRLNSEWGRAARDKTPISLMIMDIDKFKNYNDTYGHQQGDAALKTFAETAVGSLMRPGDFTARWGGEEFVILLPGTDINAAAEIAERVRANIAAAVIPADYGAETRITVSIGVNCAVPGSNIVSGDFLSKADQALYKAKESGRNRVVKHEE